MADETRRCQCATPGHCPWHDTVTDAAGFDMCRRGEIPPQSAERPCVYLGELAGNLQHQPIYMCRTHGKCTLHTNQEGYPSCDDCRERLRLTDRKLRSRWRDPLIVRDRHGNPTHCLRDMLGNNPNAFLVCGGPSINKLDFTRLRERGIFSLGVNNVAGYVPVSAFTCSDPPSKFHWGIFSDPKVMKLIPTPKLRKRRGKLRRKNADGTFDWLNYSACHCPNVWGYERRSWLAMDHTWFTEPKASWGNHQDGVDRLGEPKTACTMLLGIRLLQYLGAKRIFMLGVDFHMEPTAGEYENYSFGELRLPGAVRSNNNQYANTARWLTGLRPVFEQFGFEVFNCNPHSALRAFDYVPFELALEACRGNVPLEPFSLDNWYKKD